MEERVNGMPAADAEKLHAIAEEARGLVADYPIDRVWEIARELQLGVGVGWSEANVTVDYKTPAEIFENASALADALRERTPEARIVAFPVLSKVARATAAPLFAQVAELDVANSLQTSYEANLNRAAWTFWQELVEELPDSFLGAQFLAGRFSFDALTDEQVAALPWDALIEFMTVGSGYCGVSGAQRLLGVHPKFESTDVCADVGERLMGSASDYAYHLVPELLLRLAEHRHERTASLLTRFLEKDGEHPLATTIAITLDDKDILRSIAERLEPARVDAGDLAWDPYHVHFPFQDPIRAGFALDPTSSTEHFARYFDSGAVGDAAGAKIASDIWLVGFGETVRHGQLSLKTPDGVVLLADERWRDVAARLSRHPHLGPAAKEVLRLFGESPRSVSQLADAPETWPALVPKKRPTKADAPKKTKGSKKKANPKGAKASKKKASSKRAVSQKATAKKKAFSKSAKASKKTTSKKKKILPRSKASQKPGPSKKKATSKKAKISKKKALSKKARAVAKKKAPSKKAKASKKARATTKKKTLSKKARRPTSKKTTSKSKARKRTR